MDRKSGETLLIQQTSKLPYSPSSHPPQHHHFRRYKDSFSWDGSNSCVSRGPIEHARYEWVYYINRVRKWDKSTCLAWAKERLGFSITRDTPICLFGGVTAAKTSQDLRVVASVSGTWSCTGTFGWSFEFWGYGAQVRPKFLWSPAAVKIPGTLG